MSDYARRQREALDAKIVELRAEGWDVIARRERDKALSDRDDAQDENERLRAALDEIVDHLSVPSRPMGWAASALKTAQAALERVADHERTQETG